MLASVGNLLFRYRNGLFPFAGGLLFLPGSHLFVDPLHAAAAGAFIAGLGQLVRAATIGLRYVVRGGRGRRVYADDLVTDGIYAHTRNPMYVGNLLIVAGLAVASNCWTTVAVAIPLGCFLYASIVAAEESYLRERFGVVFDSYCRAVPRWLPHLAGLSATLASMRFRWRRLVVKEYGTPFGWVSVLVLMSLHNVWRSGNWVARRPDVQRLELVLLLAMIAWLLAWRLKRTRTLVAD